MIFADKKGKKRNNNIRKKRRAPRLNYLKKYSNARYRKEGKKAQKRQNSRAESKARKNATKTTTLFTFRKPLQSPKKHREN